MKRKFAISDIHGCPKTFEALLDHLAFTTADELYLLGDYIDRGPDSKGVIDFIWKLEREGYHVRCLRGNHEEMLLDEMRSVGQWYRNDATMQSFSCKHVGLIDVAYQGFLESLHWHFEVDGYLLVHAGLNFKAENPLADRDELTWIRDWYGDIDHDWLDRRIVVHGHTPQHRAAILKSIKTLDKTPAIGIDNGCVFDKLGWAHLCAFDLTNRAFSFMPRIEQN